MFCNVLQSLVCFAKTIDYLTLEGYFYNFNDKYEPLALNKLKTEFEMLNIIL